MATPGDGDALLLATGKLPRKLVGMRPQAHAVQQRHGLGHGLVATATQHFLLREAQVAGDGEVGNSSKCWNTMPTRARSLCSGVPGSVMLLPFTRIVPSWMGSSAFTVLMSVDFPEPDGPHTTTTSPAETVVEQFFSTWNTWLYHLLTFWISIMDMAGSGLRAGLSGRCETRLQALHQCRSHEGNEEIDEGCEHIEFGQAPVAVGHLGGGAEEIGDGEDIDQRRVLKEHDGLGEDHRSMLRSACGSTMLPMTCA